MVRPESSDYLGEASPGVMFGVVGTGIVLMFGLVASCWLV